MNSVRGRRGGKTTSSSSVLASVDIEVEVEARPVGIVLPIGVLTKGKNVNGHR